MSKLKITRIDKEKKLNKDVERIEFEHNGDKFIITPEFSYIRIHKSSIDDNLIINPCCANEIIIK